MKTHLEKTQANRVSAGRQESPSAAIRASQKQAATSPTSQLVDNRQEAHQAIDLQQLADSSSQARQAVQLQGMADDYAVRQQLPLRETDVMPPGASQVDKTKLPQNLIDGAKAHLGVDISNTEVKLNSSKPAQPGAHAIAEGNRIDVAIGQEKYLAHEAVHVAQQHKGQVKPTGQVNGVDINDDPTLEKEADVMGEKISKSSAEPVAKNAGADMIEDLPSSSFGQPYHALVIQRKVYVGIGNQVIRRVWPTDKNTEINKWIDDDVYRHFHSDKEMRTYQERQIDYIGNLGPNRKGIWARLQPRELLVVGENHTLNTMLQLANAVYTGRFMYEGFESVSDISQDYPTLTNKMNSKKPDYGLGQVYHDLENTLPKLLTALTITKGRLYKGVFNFGTGSNSGDFGIDYGLLIAKQVYEEHGRNPQADWYEEELNLINEIRNPRQNWNNIINKMANSPTPPFGQVVREAGIINLIKMTKLLQRYIEKRHFAEETDLRHMNVFRRWGKINELREGSMWERIKIANADRNRYILVGMGEAHRMRLADKLNESNINHIYMEELLEFYKTEQEKIEDRATSEKGSF